MTHSRLMAVCAALVCVAWCNRLIAQPPGPTTRPAMAGATRPAPPAGLNVAVAGNFFEADPKDLLPATQPAFATTAAATAPTTGPADAVAGAPARRPIPSAADRQQAAALAGEVFAADLADASPSARRSLADRLLHESANAASDAERFVLLIGAIHAGDDAKDLPLCFRAIDVLAATFEVDDLPIRTRLALSSSLQADSDAQTAVSCRAASGLVDRLMAADDFADASRLARALVRASSVDKPLNGEIREQAARAETLKAARAKLDGEMKKLRASPADPAANLAVGKFLCFGAGAWERGLPMLRLGGDARLSALAKRELDGPADGASRLAVADGWWDAAENDAGLYRRQARRHAARWYTSALPSLKGLERAKAEVRLRALAPPAPAPVPVPVPAKPAGPIDLLKLVVPGRDAVQGTFALQNGELVSTGMGQQRLEVRYVPPAEYDFEIEFTRYAADGPVIQILSKNGVPFIWVMETKDLVLHYLNNGGDFGPATTVRKANAILSAVRYRSLVQVRNGGVRAYLNGVLVLDWKTDYTNINPNPAFWHLRNSSFLGFGVVDRVVIHAARVTEITAKRKLE